MIYLSSRELLKKKSFLFLFLKVVTKASCSLCFLHDSKTHAINHAQYSGTNCVGGFIYGYFELLSSKSSLHQ